MKRILIVGNNDIGLHNFRIELIEELIALGNEVFFSVPLGDRVQDIEKMGAIYYPVDLNRHGMNPIQEMLLIKRYKVMLRKVKPDIILTYTIKPNIYVGILSRRAGIPCIPTITGLGTMFHRAGIKRMFAAGLYKYGIWKSSVVFFQNKANMEYFQQAGILKKSKAVLVNGAGINIDKFKPLQKEHEGTNFLFIGRIMRDKGIMEYLHEAEIIKRENINVNFLLLENMMIKP